MLVIILILKLTYFGRCGNHGVRENVNCHFIWDDSAILYDFLDTFAFFVSLKSKIGINI